MQIAMVLHHQYYEPLKDHGSQDSLTVGVVSGDRKIRRANSGPSSLNLSSLTLSDSHQSGSQLSSFIDHGSLGNRISNGEPCSTSQTSMMMARGWGSIETRRASTSLSTMAGSDGTIGTCWDAPSTSNNNPSSQNNNNNSSNDIKDEWGYFVDVAGEDTDEDVLMW